MKSVKQMYDGMLVQPSKPSLRSTVEPMKMADKMFGGKAKEDTKMKKYAEGGIYTEKLGPPPQDIDGASVTPKKPTPKKPTPKKAVEGYAKGGMTRADGCATKGKTKGRMV